MSPLFALVTGLGVYVLAKSALPSNTTPDKPTTELDPRATLSTAEGAQADKAGAPVNAAEAVAGATPAVPTAPVPGVSAKAGTATAPRPRVTTLRPRSDRFLTARPVYPAADCGGCSATGREVQATLTALNSIDEQRY